MPNVNRKLYAVQGGLVPLLMRIFSPIVRINRIIDSYLAPPSESPSTVYTDILSTIEFDRALHFGSGRDKRNLHEILNHEGEIIALDPDRDGLEQNSSPDRVIADGQQLPFEEDSFDLVFSEYVFEHLPCPELALDELRRVLKPGGSFVVLVPNPKHYYARIADITPFWFHQLWFRLQGVENAEDDRFPTQYRWGTYQQINDLAEFELITLQSFPGPTGYTLILPVHFVFALIDRILFRYPSYHVSFVAHYEFHYG